MRYFLLLLAFGLLQCTSEDQVDPISSALSASKQQFGLTVDFDNPSNYANQTKPGYVTKDNLGGNGILDKQATLGRILFYDKNLSTALVSETNQVKFKDTDIFASTKECKSLIEQVLKRKDRFLDVNKSDVLTTLYCGLNCYAFFDKFETAMEWLFSYHLDNNFGIGDADSNAAICGAIMGAKIGLRAMLQEYKTNFIYNIVSKIKTNRP
jgi:hypothetical protein